MNSLSKVLEGILDADFDIRDNDVMPGVRNWPRFLTRLKSIGKPMRVTGEKLQKWVWSDTVKPLEVLTKGIKTDLGKAIGKNKAHDISIDREAIIIATFGGVPHADKILIGNNDHYIQIESRYMNDPYLYTFSPDARTPVNTVAYVYDASLGNRIQTNVAANWKYHVVPLVAYDIIKRELGLE